MKTETTPKTIRHLRIALLIVVAALCLSIGIGVVAFNALNRTNKDLVEIVPAPLLDAAAFFAPPTPDPFAKALSTDVDYYETGEIQRIPIYEQSKIDRFILSILVVVQNGSTESEEKQTDMMFIVSYNQLQQKFTILAIPRDTLVPIEGYGWKRINAAYTYGGIGLLTNTINQAFELDIQNYVYIGTDELAALVDSVNGIPVTLTEAEAAYLNETCGAKLTAGKQQLSGAQAIAFLQDRVSDDKGDLGRAERQLEVVKSTFLYLRQSFDRNFLRPFFTTIFKSIRSNLDLETLSGIGYEMCMTDALSIKTLRLPFDGSYTEMALDGSYGILPEFEKNRILLKQALYGKEE